MIHYLEDSPCSGGRAEEQEERCCVLVVKLKTPVVNWHTSVHKTWELTLTSLKRKDCCCLKQVSPQRQDPPLPSQRFPWESTNPPTVAIKRNIQNSLTCLFSLKSQFSSFEFWVSPFLLTESALCIAMDWKHIWSRLWNKWLIFAASLIHWLFNSFLVLVSTNGDSLFLWQLCSSFVYKTRAFLWLGWHAVFTPKTVT